MDTRRTIMARFTLSARNADRLEAYLEHIRMPINSFVRCLVLDELREERLHYGDPKIMEKEE